MEFELILNELAFTPPASDQRIARQAMVAFLVVVRECVRRGARRVLRTHRGFQAQVLAADYPLVKWRNDSDVDLEARRYFKSLTTKAPFLDGLPETESSLLLHEFLLAGERAEGLGVACCLQTLAVSIDLSNSWNRSSFELERKWMLDGDERIHSTMEHVKHASTREHVVEHGNWIQERIRSGIRDGKDLWDRRGELLPRLAFCESVQAQLERLGPGHVMLEPVKSRLFELNDYCRGWADGPFDHNKLRKAAPESQSTLDQHRAQLTLSCPDGQDRLFTWHVRMTPDEWRLHFSPDGQSRTIIVGRVGRKPFI